MSIGSVIGVLIKISCEVQKSKLISYIIQLLWTDKFGKQSKYSKSDFLKTVFCEKSIEGNSSLWRLQIHLTFWFWMLKYCVLGHPVYLMECFYSWMSKKGSSFSLLVPAQFILKSFFVFFLYATKQDKLFPCLTSHKI